MNKMQIRKWIKHSMYKLLKMLSKIFIKKKKMYEKEYQSKYNIEILITEMYILLY